MSDKEILIQAAEILYQLRDGERKDEEMGDGALMALEILQGELENW